jgi:hypothetical protein
MISDPETAKQVSDLMIGIFDRLEESYRLVEQSCPADEASTFKQAIGRILSPIIIEVLNPLYGQHPHLKPATWGE